MYQFWSIFTPETREAVAEKFNNRGDLIPVLGETACPIGFAILEEYGNRDYLLLTHDEAMDLLGPQAEFTGLDLNQIGLEIENFMDLNDDRKIDNLREAMGIEDTEMLSAVSEAESIIREHQLVPA